MKSMNFGEFEKFEAECKVKNVERMFKKNGTYYFLEGISNKACKKASWKVSVKLEGKKTRYAIYSA